MAFIKKQKIVEEIEEKPTEVITESVENNLQSALLEVVSDELTYVAKLNHMIELAEEAGKDDLVSALKKSRAKIKRDIVEIYSKGKKILGLNEEVDEEAKTEVTEAIDNTKVYSGSDIYEIITNYTIDFIETDRDTYEALDSLARQFDDDEDYTAEQIDADIARYDIDAATLEAIENDISRLPDARQGRMEEFKSDLDDDISTLEMMADIDYKKLNTYAAIDRIKGVINELKEVSYDGAPNTCWGPSTYKADKRQHFIS